jgi:type IV secretion system protein VirB10
VWIFGAILLIGGLLLFNALSAGRNDAVAPTAVGQGGMIAAPPPLAVPGRFAESPFDDLATPVARVRRLPAQSGLAPVQLPAPTRPIPQRPAQPLSPDDLATLYSQMRPPEQRQQTITPPATDATLPVTTAPTSAGERSYAGRLENPSLTVPRGTIIAAVLETALNSNRPGAVRGIVSRDVRSFDGTRVLIPRGSRLYGEYAADISSGQKRALIRWQRLTRPDGVIINMDSPAADPLGRAGVRGKVNSNFLARFGPAILQSILDIGVGVATRSVDNDAVVVALPGSTQQITNQIQPNQVQPTLSVRQGTSVSVFVAQDLDFSTVDR